MKKTTKNGVTSKQNHKGAEDVALELMEEKEQVSDKACAEEIEIVLKKYSRGLQAFIQRDEYGSAARVRLVRTVPQEDKPKEDGEEAA